MGMAAKALLIYALNSCWQVPLLGVVAEMVARIQGTRRGRLLGLIWSSALLICLLLPGVAFLDLPALDGLRAMQNSVTSPAPQPTRGASQGIAKGTGGAVRAAVPLREAKRASIPLRNSARPNANQLDGMLARAPRGVLEGILLLYCGSILFALARLLWGLRQTQRLVEASHASGFDEEALAVWESCKTAMNAPQVRLLQSSELGTAVTLHWPGALVILPASLANGWSEAEMRAVFSHELAHVKRRDFLWNLLSEASGVLLFYHPVFHWMRRKVQEARELACDEMAASLMRGPRAYARCLLALSEKMLAAAALASKPGCVLGIFEGEVLERRIMNLLTKSAEHRPLRFATSLCAGAALVFGTCVLTANFGPRLANAQEASQTSHAPEGWFMAGSRPADYDTGIDAGVMNNGQPSAFLRSAVPVPEGFGTLMQTVSAKEYAGKRMRLRAWVQAKDVADWAGVWMRVDRDQTMVAFDNMQQRPIKGTQAWKSADVVLDVPKDATSISFGILLSRSGQVWMNDLNFEEVGADVPVTGVPVAGGNHLPERPVNLKFGR